MLPARFFPRAVKAELIGMVGLFLVLAGLTYPISISNNIPLATVVVFGASLLILAGQNESPVVTRLLTFYPLVIVGLVSYSLYLWHWPILVLSQYYLVRELYLFEIIVAFVFMMVCNCFIVFY